MEIKAKSEKKKKIKSTDLRVLWAKGTTHVRASVNAPFTRAPGTRAPPFGAKSQIFIKASAIPHLQSMPGRTETLLCWKPLVNSSGMS